MTTKVNKATGEITETFYDEWDNLVEQPKLNQQIYKKSIRPNGTLRIQQDFSYSPTMAEQHTAHLTDINYLIKKYKPDELAAYIAARNQYRQEILGHDFAAELTLQEAKNVVYRSQQEFEALPDDLKHQFKNHVEFLKFVDNPANAHKLIKAGYITQSQLENLLSLDKVAANPANAKADDVGGERAKADAKPSNEAKTKTKGEAS